MNKKYLIKTKGIPCTESSMTNTFNEAAKQGFNFETTIVCGGNSSYLFLVFSKEESKRSN